MDFINTEYKLSYCYEILSKILIDISFEDFKSNINNINIVRGLNSALIDIDYVRRLINEVQK